MPTASMARAGAFLTDHVEQFTHRFAVFIDDDRGADVDDFPTFTAGLNYHLVPESPLPSSR
jgi:hypothetical protein